MQALDVLALNLPSKHVLPEALSFAQTAIQSPDPLQRAAACTVIVDVAEGCADAVRKHLPAILQVLYTLNESQGPASVCFPEGPCKMHASIDSLRS